jgi:transcription initiation factor TFIIA small subunit
MSFAQYRVSTIGIELEETLQELLNEGVIDIDLTEIIRKQFDKAIIAVLRKWVKDKPIIKGKLKHYKNCDNVWVFQILNPEIRVSSYSLPIQINEPLKIVACDTKAITDLSSKKSKKKIKK